MFKISVEKGKLDLLFVCEQNEFSGVKKIADKVRLDVQRITGILPDRRKDACCNLWNPGA